MLLFYVSSFKKIVTMREGLRQLRAIWEYYLKDIIIIVMLCFTHMFT